MKEGFKNAIITQRSYGMKKIIGLVLIQFALIGCSPFIENRGFNHETLDISVVQIGVDTKDTIMEKFGSPSSTSLYPSQPGLKDSKWFFITKQTSTSAFFKPDTLNQQTVVVSFNEKDVVTEVQKIEGETVVAVNKNKTENTGYETNVMRDIFGNFGKYSAKTPGQK